MQARQRLRGISLIESLVALAVMAFGMLAMVGVQSTMRQNSDIAKQRSEAVRIAQEALEQWRAFSVLESSATPGIAAYDDIAGPSSEPVLGISTNTAYSLTRDAVPAAGLNQKAVQVTVTWADRTGREQRVALSSVIAWADPMITGAMINAPAGNPSRRPRGRMASIPLLAKEMGGGLSAFKLPGDGSTTVWVFNNLSGMIVGMCTVPVGLATADIVNSDIASCSDNASAHLLSGYVQFSTGLVQPTAADAQNPSSNAFNLDMVLTLTSTGHPGPAQCFDNAPSTAALAALRTSVAYYCAIPANTTRSWSGYATVRPEAFTDVEADVWTVPTTTRRSGRSHQVCRYTPAADDAVLVPNIQHPYLYRIEYEDPGIRRKPLRMPPLTNQNYLIVRGELLCPTDVPADPAAGDFINSNTLVHLPWPLR